MPVAKNQQVHTDPHQALNATLLGSLGHTASRVNHSSIYPRTSSTIQWIPVQKEGYKEGTTVGL